MNDGLTESSLREAGSVRPPPARRSDADELMARISAFSRLVDEDAGRSEEQRFIETADGPLFTTLVEPLGARRDVGFVICHSFAFEQFELFPLELLFARRAASAGFPTLYVQVRGYADSGGLAADASPRTHRRDVVAGAADLIDRASVPDVIPVGARFGAAIALLAAGDLRAPGVALWQPTFDLTTYLDGLLRAFARSQVMDVGSSEASAVPRPTTETLKAALASGSEIDLFGYPLTPALYAESRATRVIGPSPMTGRALLLAVNSRADKEIDRGRSELEERGVEVAVTQAEGPGRAAFGLGVPVGGHLATHAELFEDIAARTIRWAEEAW